MALSPEISVVIPTRRRRQLLLRALRSVFAQTFEDIEAIVVVDGPDEETAAALRAVRDPRLRIFVNPISLTAAGARNAGVVQAAGRWIAFLDDDDEWLPTKLERQVACARSNSNALISCLSQVLTPVATYVWPEEIFSNARPVDEYLFDRKSFFAGSSFMQTSSYLIRRDLYLQCPFRVDTPHDDWDFVLRLSNQLGVSIETVPEVLVKVYFEERRPSLGSTGSWLASLNWIDQMQPMLTPRAYSGFCLGVVGPRAAREGAYPAFAPLLLQAFRKGSPTALQLLVFLAFWVMPQDLRRRVRSVFRGHRCTRG